MKDTPYTVRWINNDGGDVLAKFAKKEDAMKYAREYDKAGNLDDGDIIQVVDETGEIEQIIEEF